MKHVRATASQSASVGVDALMNWKSVTVGRGAGYAALAAPELPIDPARAATADGFIAKSSIRSQLIPMLAGLFPNSSISAGKTER